MKDEPASPTDLPIEKSKPPDQIAGDGRHDGHSHQLHVELQQSEQRYRALVKATTQMVWTTNAAGEFIAEQPDWAAYTGQTFEEYRGYGWAQALHPDERARTNSVWQRALSSGTLYESECRIRRHDGLYRWFAVRAAPILDETGAIFEWIGADTDITEQKRAETRLRRHETQLRADLADARRLQQISTQLIQEDDVEALYGAILDAAAAIMRSEYSSIQILHPERGDGGELQLLRHRGFNPEAAAFWEWVLLTSHSACGEALRTGERVVVADVATCDFMAGSDDQEMYLRSGIHAVQSTPLFSRGGQLLGMISTHWRERHRPSEHELRLMDVLARQAADLIERSRAEHALRDSEEKMRRSAARDAFLVALGDRLRGLTDPRDVMVAACEQLGVHLTANRVLFGEVEADEEHVVVHNDFCDGVPSIAGRYRLLDFGPAMLELLRAGRDFVVPDVDAYSAFSPPEHAAYAAMSVRAGVAVPLVKGGRLRTILTIHQSAPRPWAPDDVALVREVAERTWAAVERAKAEDALRRLNDTLEERIAERTAELAQSEEQLRQMASRLTMAEQEERRRISKILHDDLQQQLYGVQMKLSFARQDLGSGDMAATLEELAEIEELLAHCIGMTRQLTVDLSPPILKSEGLADMVRWLVTQMHEMYGLDVTLVAEHAFPIANEDMRVLLFQSIRELLFNVVKHANTDRASVELRDHSGGNRSAGNRLFIRVADDGRGFDASTIAARAPQEDGFGLFSVRERLRLFGGQMHVDSAPGHGARIKLDVPL